MVEEENITLTVEGMTCAHCAMTITKVLENNGAENPSVNYATGEASFHLHNEKNLPKILSGISKAGYKASVLDNAHTHGHEHHHGASSVEKKFFITLPFTIILFFSHMIFPHDFIL